MPKLKKNIAFFLILIFCYPEVSSGLHFLFFHHTKPDTSHLFHIPLIKEKDVNCHFDDIKYPPFSKIEAKSFFLFVSISETLAHHVDEPKLKKRYLFMLRGPPVYNYH